MATSTGDAIYREWGWSIFRAFEMFSKLPTGGYTVMSNVGVFPPTPGEKMESFWLAETLKYLYLLFRCVRGWAWACGMAVNGATCVSLLSLTLACLHCNEAAHLPAHHCTKQ